MQNWPHKRAGAGLRLYSCCTLLARPASARALVETMSALEKNPVLAPLKKSLVALLLLFLAFCAAILAGTIWIGPSPGGDRQGPPSFIEFLFVQLFALIALFSLIFAVIWARRAFRTWRKPTEAGNHEHEDS